MVKGWQINYRKGLKRPPILRSSLEKETERHATWLELLYDLVFVTIISQLSTKSQQRLYLFWISQVFDPLYPSMGGMDGPHILPYPL